MTRSPHFSIPSTPVRSSAKSSLKTRRRSANPGAASQDVRVGPSTCLSMGDGEPGAVEESGELVVHLHLKPFSGGAADQDIAEDLVGMMSAPVEGIECLGDGGKEAKGAAALGRSVKRPPPRRIAQSSASTHSLTRYHWPPSVREMLSCRTKFSPGS